MVSNFDKHNRKAELELEAEIVRQEWLAKRRMGRKVTEDKPQWKLDQEQIAKEAKELGDVFVYKMVYVTQLLWPIVRKSYAEVIKSVWEPAKVIMDRARKCQRDRAKWEAEQERTEDDSKDPGK